MNPASKRYSSHVSHICRGSEIVEMKLEELKSYNAASTTKRKDKQKASTRELWYTPAEVQTLDNGKDKLASVCGRA